MDLSHRNLLRIGNICLLNLIMAITKLGWTWLPCFYTERKRKKMYQLNIPICATASGFIKASVLKNKSLLSDHENHFSFINSMCESYVAKCNFKSTRPWSGSCWYVICGEAPGPLQHILWLALHLCCIISQLIYADDLLIACKVIHYSWAPFKYWTS